MTKINFVFNFFQANPFIRKKASSLGSRPKNFTRLSAESTDPPGAKIKFLYFMPNS